MNICLHELELDKYMHYYCVMSFLVFLSDDNLEVFLSFATNLL